MGVARLLQVLKSITKPVNLSNFSGSIVGIDGYSWLHKSVILCATDLALDRPTFKYVDYFESRIRLLRANNVEPYFVFDGDELPTKSSVEKNRSTSRQTAREKGIQLYEAGKLKEAAEQFQKCVDITPKMTAAVIDLLDRIKVRYLVAPYEADAQLVYLEKINHIQAIISEDSDLLVFGAKVLLTKMDPNGNFMEVRRDRFHQCTDLCLAKLTDADLRLLAILSGCDYSSGIPGIGLSKANALIRKYGTYDRIERVLKLEGTVKLPADFRQTYEQANLTFLHQRVFCPVTQSVVMLNPIGENELLIDGFNEFIGKEKQSEISIEISKGRMDPTSHEIIQFPILPALKTYSLPTTPIPLRTINSFFQVAQKSISTPIQVRPSSTVAGQKRQGEQKTQNEAESLSIITKRKFKYFIGSDDDIGESNISGFFDEKVEKEDTRRSERSADSVRSVDSARSLATERSEDTMPSEASRRILSEIPRNDKLETAKDVHSETPKIMMKSLRNVNRSDTPINMFKPITPISISSKSSANMAENSAGTTTTSTNTSKTLTNTAKTNPPRSPTSFFSHSQTISSSKKYATSVYFWPDDDTPKKVITSIKGSNQLKEQKSGISVKDQISLPSHIPLEEQTALTSHKSLKDRSPLTTSTPLANRTPLTNRPSLSTRTPLKDRTNINTPITNHLKTSFAKENECMESPIESPTISYTEQKLQRLESLSFSPSIKLRSPKFRALKPSTNQGNQQKSSLKHFMNPTTEM